MQYQRHLYDESDDNDDDELSQTIRSIPAAWDRQHIYEYFAQRTKAIHGFRLIPYPDWINASGSPLEEKFYIKDRAVCRYMDSLFFDLCLL